MTYYPALGDLIRKEMHAKKLTARFLGTRLYEHLQFNNPDTAENYINWVRKGSIYGNTSTRAKEKILNVERLAIFLYAVGFEENHLIIHAIQREDARFIYPPLLGVPYEGLKRNEDARQSLEDQL